jgi:hypothetical protein
MDFTTLDGMIRALAAADRAGKLDSRLRSYTTKSQLLVIDEVGYLPPTRAEANDLFQVISNRYEKSVDHPAVTFHRSSSKRSTIVNMELRPRWPDSRNPVSGIPGAVQTSCDSLSRRWSPFSEQPDDLIGSETAVNFQRSEGHRLLDLLLPEAGAFYVMDRGYLDFERLYALDQAGAFFVIRAKSNMDARRVYSAPVDRSTGLVCDQAIVLNGYYSSRHYPQHLRRIRFKDPDSGKTLVFLTNHFQLHPLTVCTLYRSR